LAALKHFPQLPGGTRDDWWEAYQAAFDRAAGQQQQQRQQQQQQQWQQRQQRRQQQMEAVPEWQRAWVEQQLAAPLQQQQQQQRFNASLAVKVLWAAGRLKVTPNHKLLSLLLQQLQGNLQGVEQKQVIGVIVGLASIFKDGAAAAAAVLSSEGYQELCQAVMQQGGQLPQPDDMANLLRCFGSIAASTAAAAAADGNAGGAMGVDGDGGTAAGQDGRRQQQQQQQEQLLPPEYVIEWLLDAVEPCMSQLTDSSLTMMLWGLRKLGHMPTQHWLDR
jgi:hypothetical protein